MLQLIALNALIIFHNFRRFNRVVSLQIAYIFRNLLIKPLKFTFIGISKFSGLSGILNLFS